MAMINPWRFAVKQWRRWRYEEVEHHFAHAGEGHLQSLSGEMPPDLFSGGNPTRFENAGRLQLITLLKLGLSPGHRVLDVGCGCLRGGYWLIHFLDRGGYRGIEPNAPMLAYGLEHYLEPEERERKQPRFDHNDRYDFGVFGETFDYVVARSIWTHADKAMIGTMLDQFALHGKPGARFLASYLKPYWPGQDYKGTGWVGRDHRQKDLGVVFHSLARIREAAARRGLTVTELPFDVYTRQIWLVITRAD
jgi:SAM-dependent methyltransferase